MVAPGGEALPDTNNAVSFVAVCGVFGLFAVGLCAARIYSRVRPKLIMRVEDYLIIIPTILCVADYFVAVASSVHGWGHRSSHVSKENRVIVFKCLFVQQVLWILTVALIRISLSFSLLRIITRTPLRWTLWAMMGIQTITYVGHMVFVLGGCTPIRANWEPVADLTCWDHKYVLAFGWVANSLLVLIDFLLAIMPVQLILTLNRSTREKILICCLMAMGLFAAAIAAYRMSLSKKTFAGDIMSTTVKMSLWCQMEALVGIIAACVPCLKAPAERLLRQFGLFADRFEMTKPSFVVSLQDHEGRPSSGDSNLVDSVHKDGKGGKMESNAGKSVVSAVEVDHSVT